MCSCFTCQWYDGISWGWCQLQQILRIVLKSVEKLTTAAAATHVILRVLHLNHVRFVLIHLTACLLNGEHSVCLLHRTIR